MIMMIIIMIMIIAAAATTTTMLAVIPNLKREWTTFWGSLWAKVAGAMMPIGWYHDNLTRHAAEALLLSNGSDGSYLLRKSNGKTALFSLSVRAKDSVKHFHVEYTGNSYKFGFNEFLNLRDLIMHFANQPLIGSETGTLTVLKHPYPRKVEEPAIYESVRVHTAMQTGKTEIDLIPSAPSLGTKEGYLTKQGKIVKNWKTRWFTLHRNELKYYKDQTFSISNADILSLCKDWSRSR
ncbi:dual adapter for phosphotyrosine and 3-phosphotyrosine and 3-phosphoinositide isoform 3-T3 [Liasis olivaceus]